MGAVITGLWKSHASAIWDGGNSRACAISFTRSMTKMMDEHETPEPRKSKGGRPPLPDAPTSAAECRRLLAIEVVKTTPHTPRLKGLQTLLESFERQDKDAPVADRLAQSQAD